jgi:hypothetical protein
MEKNSILIILVVIIAIFYLTNSNENFNSNDVYPITVYIPIKPINITDPTILNSPDTNHIYNKKIINVPKIHINKYNSLINYLNKNVNNDYKPIGNIPGYLYDNNNNYIENEISTDIIPKYFIYKWNNSGK